MSRFRTHDGVSIAYELRGCGDVVFVCHGGPAETMEYAIADLQDLEDNFTLVYHDYRGSGLSDNAAPTSYTFLTLARDLNDLRLHLGYRQISLLAHSMGGFIALTYALSYPDACTRISLVAATPAGRPRRLVVNVLRALGLSRGLRLIVQLARLGALRLARRDREELEEARHAVLVTLQERMVSKDAGPRRKQFHNDNLHVLERAIRKTDLTSDLDKITSPIQVIVGRDDALMFAGMKLFRRRRRPLEVHVIPDVGHDVFAQAPDAVFPLIESFLRKKQ
jgi:proline iminopeptidase